MAMRQYEVLKKVIPVLPGDTVKECMEFHGLTMDDFAQRLGVSKQTLARIYRGDQPITTETACKLACVTGVDAGFWLRLEANYQIAKYQEVMAQKLQEDVAWVNKFPIDDLIRRNFLPRDYKKMDALEQVKAFLNFFQMSSVDVYQKRLEENLFAARTTKGVVSNRYAIETWIQMGLRVLYESGVLSHIPSYDKKCLLTTLDKIKAESVKLNESTYLVREFLLKIKELLKSAGVSLIYLKNIKGVNKVNGIVRWVENRPVILLSLNGQDVAGILFSLFHEIGHIINDGKNLSYVSCGEKTQEEQRADAFASEQLISSALEREILHLPFELSGFKDIATRANVYVGVVVGRYKHLTSGWNRSLAGFTPRKISWNELGGWTL